VTAAAGQALAPKLVEKPWGRDTLPAPFEGSAGTRIGEIWFEPPPELDALLAKYLFTSEALSVQVHPDDARAPQGTRGKEECWLVLDAEPGARLAIGFRRPVSAGDLRAAAQDGSVEELLAWHPVTTGDFFYLPAGTVHAIGAGLTIAELQQNSDVTYRLYDYGRPRALHLDEALEVANRGIYHDPRQRRVEPDETCALVDGPHFRLAQVVGVPDATTLAQFDKPLMILPLSGEVTIGADTISAGGCGWAKGLDAVRFGMATRALLLSACE
jgi:mannose-6-phosphate isomerase